MLRGNFVHQIRLNQRPLAIRHLSGSAGPSPFRVEQIDGVGGLLPVEHTLLNPQQLTTRVTEPSTQIWARPLNEGPSPYLRITEGPSWCSNSGRDPGI